MGATWSSPVCCRCVSTHMVYCISQEMSLQGGQPEIIQGVHVTTMENLAKKDVPNRGYVES